MFKWLRAIFKKKNKATGALLNELKGNTCETCVWWAAEEENNLALLHTPKNGNRYCDVYKTFTGPKHTCHSYKEERYEATVESIQTEEIEINHDLELEGSQLNDTGSRQK